MRARTLSLLLIFVPGLATGQDSTVKLWTKETINSARLNETRSILVATPEGYSTSKNRYPVLVILDAEDRPQDLVLHGRWRM